MSKHTCCVESREESRERFCLKEEEEEEDGEDEEEDEDEEEKEEEGRVDMDDWEGKDCWDIDGEGCERLLLIA